VTLGRAGTIAANKNCARPGKDARMLRGTAKNAE
jgi:hypothetical protein